MRVAWGPHLRGALIATALMAAAMSLYFLIAHDGRESLSTRTFLDEGAPLWPAFVWVYLSIYALTPFLAVGASWETTRAALLRGAIVLGLTFLCFIFVPTHVERPDLSGLDPGPSAALLRWVYAIDTPARNAAPSGHVSLTMLIAWVAWRTLRRPLPRALVVGYAAAVAGSIVLVGQHHVLDLITGAAVGALALALPAGISRERGASL